MQGLSGWAWGQFGCTNLLGCADGMCAQGSRLLLLWDLGSAVNGENFSNIFPLEFSCSILCFAQAVYNLAYMVEYNYSLAGIRWNNIDKNSVQKGNLTFAAILYEK